MLLRRNLWKVFSSHANWAALTNRAGHSRIEPSHAPEGIITVGRRTTALNFFDNLSESEVWLGNVVSLVSALLRWRQLFDFLAILICRWRRTISGHSLLTELLKHNFDAKARLRFSVNDLLLTISKKKPLCWTEQAQEEVEVAL